MPSILLHLQTFNDTLPLSTDNSYGLKLPQHLHRMADSSCDKKCSRDKWHETSFAVEVQKDHDILESSSCLLPCRPAHISGLGWHLTRRGSALTHSRRKKKKAEGDFGVVSWDRLVYSSLLEDNYSLIQFMIQNAPNPLTNASFPPPSTFQSCWPNKWWLFLPG